MFFWKKIDYFKALILLSILPIIFFYGSARIKENIFINNRVISVIQPNVLQSDKIDSSDGYEDIKNLIDLSNSHEADLIIWPESSVPLLLQYNPEVIQFIIDNISSKSEILIGNVTFQNEKFRNSALLIDQSKEIKAVYDKTHLVPIGQYMPFKSLLSKFPLYRL